MSNVKKVLLTILVFIMLLCLASDALYLVIQYFFPKKMIANTFNVDDLIVTNDSGDSLSLGKIMELNYYANEDDSGIEMFEIKLNTLKNEESQSTFSTGLQIIPNSDEKLYSYWNCFSSGGNGVGNSWLFYDMTFNGSTYYYNVDGSNTSYVASLPIEEDSYFLITIGDEQFRMHPRKIVSDDKTKLEPYFYSEYEDQFLWWSTRRNYLIDWNYIASILLKSVQSLEPGYDGTITFKFGDIFDYYQYDEESKTYTKVERIKDGSLLEEVINNYYTIKVNTYYSGATVAEDSLFGIIENDKSYNKTDSVGNSDFSLSRQIITLNQYAFDFKYVEGTDIDFKIQIKDTTKQYLSGKSKYLLYIKLDRQVLIDNDINYVGVIYDNFLTEDIIYKVEVV